MKGKTIFNKQPTLFAVFKNIGSLEKSNLVKINGLPIGTVYDYRPSNKEVDNVIVEIHLNQDINIPANSVAYIDGSLVGSSFISIAKGNANGYLQTGDTIATRLEGNMLSEIKTQFAPTVTRVNETVDSLKYVLGKINSIFDPTTNANIQTLIANLSRSSVHLSHLLDTENGMVTHAMANLNAVTGNLAKSNDQITQSIRNVEIITSNVANARIQETVAALEGTISQLKSTVSAFDKNLNNPNGTMGKLMNDQKLYNQLNQAALSLEVLLDDVRVHPKRYVNISVFGGKNKGEPLTAPTIKDTIVVTSQK
ncbi:MlaD family protein [Paraflavisolibacter sp. H34]|uniref:MlaD family protein n=1 Tax=Huijunlia imazamoxiresistens TaxID=3127457 RepID=UPI003017AD02